MIFNFINIYLQLYEYKILIPTLFIQSQESTYLIAFYLPLESATVQDIATVYRRKIGLTSFRYKPELIIINFSTGSQWN